MNADETVLALREAVRACPDNLPLRRHLADVLLDAGRAAEAEQEYCVVLRGQPGDAGLKLRLAGAYLQQDKSSHALVIVEELLRSPATPPAAYLVHSRLLMRAGDREAAAGQYRRAIEEDSSLADRAIEKELGLDRQVEGRDEVVGDRIRLSHAVSEPGCDGVVEKPTINFDDVGGMEAIKEEIRVKIIHPLDHPDLYAAYGKPIGGGILLYGPPGCGKTLLARGTAGEIRASFVSVNIDAVLEMWLGQSERNLHQFFDYARRHKPCVLFFDEVDAIAAKREELKYSAGRQVINQFLAELDGVRSSNEGVLILAATNAPWHLDPAFRRPGRFDRVIVVPPPDEPARVTILNILVKGKPVRELDCQEVARQTEGYSGADLAAVVDLAVEGKLREAVRGGTRSHLTTADLLAAVKATRPSTREWSAMARNYVLYANQSGIYDDVARYLKLT